MKKKKEDGNAAFKREEYQEAYNLYNEALTIDPHNIMTNAKLHFNKATVAFKVLHYLYIFFIKIIFELDVCSHEYCFCVQ